jgi:hypothetical protein
VVVPLREHEFFFFIELIAGTLFLLGLGLLQPLNPEEQNALVSLTERLSRRQVAHNFMARDGSTVLSEHFWCRN